MSMSGSTQELSWDEFRKEVQAELEQTQRTLREVSLMLEQSRGEMTKLTQRNAAITSHLQQMQGQFETIARADIRMAYDSALDGQQRLFVLRSQMEKLQSDQDWMQRYIQLLEKTLGMIQADELIAKTDSAGGRGAALMEMVVDAQEAVRQRLSKQMHDGPAQTLSNFIVQTEIASRLFDVDPEKARDELGNLKSSAMVAFQKVRNFIFELRPMMLDDLGLIPTLRRYIATYKDQTNVDISFSIHGHERRFEPHLEVMIFRAIQDLVGNSIRINAEQPIKLQVEVLVVVDDSHIKVTVSDNGKTIDESVLHDNTSLGLKFIKERVEMLEGIFEIESIEGKGSKIKFQVPVIEFSKN
jgi:two-component system sensor histidine kinase DegS